jgi:hypothetical protein
MIHDERVCARALAAIALIAVAPAAEGLSARKRQL